MCMEKYLLDPKASNAFSSEVMHKVVLNGIDFELPENIWDAIDDAFGNYWNHQAKEVLVFKNKKLLSVTRKSLEDHSFFKTFIRRYVK